MVCNGGSVGLKHTPLRSSRPCIYEKLIVASLSNYLIKIKPPALSIKVKGRRLLFVPGQLYSREVLRPRSQILRLASLAPVLSVAFLRSKYPAGSIVSDLLDYLWPAE